MYYTVRGSEINWGSDMERIFFGLMPYDKIEKRKFYRVDNGRTRITIDAGPEGWTITVAGISTTNYYKDDPKGTESNFREAYNIICDMFGNVEEEPESIHLSMDEINRLISH